MVYYKKIKGKNYDGGILDIANKSVKGKSDGRISISDAKKILNTVKDGNDYTDLEKKTIQYVRDNYKFTPEADLFFRSEIRKWAAKKGGKMNKAKAVKRPKKAAPKSKKTVKTKTQAARPKIVEEEVIQTPVASRVTEKAAQAPEKNGMKIVLFALVFLIILFFLAAYFYKPLKNKIFKADFAGKKSGEIKLADDIKPAADAKAAIEAKKAVQEKESMPPDKNVYVVQVKDTLIEISEKMTGDYKNWQKIFEANKNTLNSPVLIFPGQRLKIPDGLVLKK